MWFIGVEVDKRRLHPLLKKILDPPLLQRSFRQKIKYRIVSPILLPYKLSISIYKNANKNISMYAWNKSICLSPWLYSNMIPMIFSNTSWKSMKLLWGNIAFQKQFAFYRKRPNIRIVQFYNDFIPKFLHYDINALIDFTQTASQTSSQLLEEKAPVNDFGKKVPGAEKYGCR